MKNLEPNKKPIELTTEQYTEIGKNCIDFIKKTEAILKNGYYHRFGSFCLITYNSGNQKDLNVYQTVNLVLSKSLSELLKIDEESARNLISNYYDNSRRFDTLDIINELKSCNIIIADRDKIVCADIRFDGGGEVSKNVDTKLKELGFVFNNSNYRYGKTINKNDYITAFYDKRNQLYKIRGTHKFKTPLGENSVGIQFDFDNEEEFYNKIQEYSSKSINNPDIRYAKGGLIAPNGKVSNLTAEQFKLVRTPAFKKWFGDWENDSANASKVVDENGEPMICYHATDNKFWEFKKEKQVVGYYGKGFYFSNSLEKAKQYGKRVIPAFLNIKSIFELSDETPQKLLNELAEANVGIEDIGEDRDIEQRSKYTFGYASENADIFMNNLVKNGYYGIRMVYDLESTTYFFIVFDSNQIKLADGTNTTFDGNNSDIRFGEGGLVGNIYTQMKYAITIGGEDWSEPYVKEIDDYEDALSEYESIDSMDFPNPNSKQNTKALDEVTRKYKFIGDLDEGESMNDLTDFLNDKKLWKLIDEDRDIKKYDSIEPINEKSNDLLYEIQNHFRATNGYNTIYLDEDGEKTLKLRIKDHSGKHKNQGDETYFLSIVISNLNPTSHFRTSYEGFSNEKEYEFDSDTSKDEIIDFINEKIQTAQQMEGIKNYKVEYSLGGALAVISVGAIVTGLALNMRGVTIENPSKIRKLYLDLKKRAYELYNDASKKWEKIPTSKFMEFKSSGNYRLLESNANEVVWVNKDMFSKGGELSKGIKVESEHIGTAKKLFKREITPQEGIKEIAKEHLKEDKKYYSKLTNTKKGKNKGGFYENPFLFAIFGV